LVRAAQRSLRKSRIPVNHEKLKGHKMKMISRFVCATIASMALCQNSMAQFRPPQQPVGVPPNAYQQMDTHSTIDPRILRAQQEAQEAKEKAERFEARKWEYRRTIQERINQNPEWRGLQGYPFVGQQMALEDAAHYFALRDIENPTIAKQWLDFRKAQIQRAMQEEIRTQAIMAAHDTAVAVAAVGAQAVGDEEVKNAGQAAKAGNAAQTLATATSWHYDFLDKFTR
jgi:hypothetical protein